VLSSIPFGVFPSFFAWLLAAFSYSFLVLILPLTQYFFVSQIVADKNPWLTNCSTKTKPTAVTLTWLLEVTYISLCVSVLISLPAFLH